jgi:lysophospholipase L1-like esterase
MTKQSFHKKRILFFGDSLTQYGTLPEGYISLLTEYLNSHNLSDQFELVGAGIGGDKVYDLYLRLPNDVLNHNPDVVVILIGINDIWHKTSGIGTDAIKFKRFFEAIIDKIQANNIELFLATPTLIGELKDLQNVQDQDLEEYSQIIRDLATTKNCKLIDLRKIFINYIQQHNTNNNLLGVLTTDKVHLNNKGNQLVTENLKSIFFI